MIFLGSFFQIFGFLAFIGCIVIFIMSSKLLKKELPTEQEKKEMIAKHWITGTEKKMQLRQITLKYRYFKEFKEMQKNSLVNQTKHK